jgi:hypothetical protein
LGQGASLGVHTQVLYALCGIIFQIFKKDKKRTQGIKRIGEAARCLALTGVCRKRPVFNS